MEFSTIHRFPCSVIELSVLFPRYFRDFCGLEIDFKVRKLYFKLRKALFKTGLERNGKEIS